MKQWDAGTLKSSCNYSPSDPLFFSLFWVGMFKLDQWVKKLINPLLEMSVQSLQCCHKFACTCMSESTRQDIFSLCRLLMRSQSSSLAMELQSWLLSTLHHPFQHLWELPSANLHPETLLISSFMLWRSSWQLWESSMYRMLSEGSLWIMPLDTEVIPLAARHTCHSR